MQARKNDAPIARLIKPPALKIDLYAQTLTPFDAPGMKYWLDFLLLRLSISIPQ